MNILKNGRPFHYSDVPACVKPELGCKRRPADRNNGRWYRRTKIKQRGGGGGGSGTLRYKHRSIITPPGVPPEARQMFADNRRLATRAKPQERPENKAFLTFSRRAKLEVRKCPNGQAP